MAVDVLGFAVFAGAMVGTPGPANMVLMASGARYGLRRSLPFVAGVALGKQFLIWPMGFGLLSLAERAPMLFLALKALSAAYVLWLAWRIAGARIAPGEAAAAPPGFLAGLVVHPLNPKAWAMIATGFTAFTASGAAPLPATLTIAAVLLALQVVLHPIWCAAGEWLARAVAGRPAERRIMVALGVLTAASVVWALLS